jgi:hypothetical protein
LNALHLLWPQKHFFFFLIKRTKNQVTSAMLLCAQAIALQSGAAPRAV